MIPRCPECTARDWLLEIIYRIGRLTWIDVSCNECGKEGLILLDDKSDQANISFSDSDDDTIDFKLDRIGGQARPTDTEDHIPF